MKVSIIGSGVVGQAHGKFLAKKCDVLFYDIKNSILRKLHAHRLKTTLSLKRALDHADINFICLPTPSTKKGIDLTIMKNVCKECGNLCPGGRYVFKSTMVPGSTEKLAKLLNTNEANILYNPEFLTEISSSWTQERGWKRTPLNEERIVIGLHPQSGSVFADELIKLYWKCGSVANAYSVSWETAEMIKYVANCRLASSISFFNEIYFICKELGINSELVTEIVCEDKRIGRYGSVHGKAFGGTCFPKDIRAFIGFVENNLKYEPILLNSIESVNDMIKRKKGVRE